MTKQEELEQRLEELKHYLKSLSIEMEKCKLESLQAEKKKLPEKWEDLEGVQGFYVDDAKSIVQKTGRVLDTTYGNKCVFKTKSQAKASVSVAQLSQLRDVYRNGWEPYWSKTHQDKWCINQIGGEISVYHHQKTHFFLAFQDKETAKLFLKNFRNLIEEAAPLLFG
jgi:DNA repair exonuclease SbcCD ATPase subunit